MFLTRNTEGSRKASISTCAVLSVFLLFSTGYAKEKVQKSLLILHSYHPSLSWTDSVMEGMQEALAESGEPVQLYVDYMDTRRYSGKEYRAKMEALLLHKLAKEKFDLVLLSDNDALDFLLRHRRRVAPKVPLIFCGINNFTESILAGQRGITGVAEEVSLHETIVTALKLHPGTTEIIVIGRTILPADRANREAFLSLLQSFKQTVKLTFWNDLSAKELRARLPLLPRGSLVFINGLTSDETGRQLLYDETTRLIRESSDVPLYSLWDVYLGHGIVGGKLVSAYLQGKLAGELAVRVLRGEAPDKIPVIRREAANKFMFDYRELSRFGLSIKDLPEGSEVMHTPSSFYVVNKIYIWTGVVSLLIFSCIIVLFGINILARKRAEEAARQLAGEKAVMAEIGRIISSTLNIDEVYVRFVEEVRKLVPFDGIAINIINRKEGVVTIPYVSGLRIPGRQSGDTFAFEGSVTGEVAQTCFGLIIQLTDERELQARFPTLLTAFGVGVRSVIVVPLISKDQAIGAIHFRSAKPNAYSEQELKLAERIADQIAGAIANAQLFIEGKQAEEALRKSEQRFSVFMEHLPAVVFIKDPSGRLLFANRYLQEFFGWEECVGKTTEALMPPEIAERMIADDRRVLTGGPMVIQERIIDIRGAEHFFDTYKFPIPAEGAPILLGGISVDITQRIKAERELANTKVLLQSAFEQTPVPMVLVNAPDGIILNVNRACIEMLGVEDKRDPVEQSLIGFNPTWQDLDAEGKRVPWKELPLALALQGVTTRNREMFVLRKDGTRRWEMVNAAPIYNEAGEMIAAILVCPDITDRKRAEEALRDSEARFRHVVESSPLAIGVANQGGVEYVNPKFVEKFGYTLEDVPTLADWFRLATPDPAYRQSVIERWRALLERTADERHASHGIEVEVICKGGSVRTIEVFGTPMGNKTLAVFNDLTERKRMEEERGRLEAQMREVQKLESLGVLAGGIAHDFNNLLMAILGNADLALFSLSSVSPARHNIEEIVKASQRAADLCRQMLAYSGRGRFVLGRYNLSEIVREMAHMLQVSVSKKATARYRFAEGLPAVEADATQLRQVVMNLITNASDALGDASGIIEISSGVMECDRAYLSESYLDDKLPEGRYVYLEVSDTGCGMDAETRSKIFDPFFTTKLMGRGLGLAAVLGIVRGHKGAIKVYSEPGKGTIFRVLLPAVEWTPADRTGVAEQSTPPPMGGTILLIDDDESVLDVGSRMLERLGFTVLTASDGEKGLDVFQERAAEIDCVLLDLSMPRLSGEEVFREMRRIRSDVQVILSSGYNEHEVTQRFAGKGLAGFAQKPYTLAELREILKRVLG